MNKIVLLSLLAFISSCSEDHSNNIEVKNNKKHHFIKSAHYFSSAWPKTFWQEFEEADVPSELKQIKSDGFNTIVLTVPWRGFETGFQNTQTQSDPILYKRLSFMLKRIQEQGLSYMLRLGFPHDYTPNTNTNILSQCTGIYTNEKVRNQWSNYLQKINSVTKPYQNSSVGTLVSWEDFWCPHFVFPNLSETERLTLAQEMEFGTWLKSQDLNILKVMFKENDFKFDQVKIPQPSELAYVLYLEFIDNRLKEHVLTPLKSIFSDASLEIRVDKLAIKQDEHYTWIGHDLFLDEPNHRGTYWAPFWGAENKGELLTSDQALKNFEYFLNIVTNEGENTNHVIEQFNFYDNTPYFPNNANIQPDQIDDFLSGAAPLLKKYSQGFGVWAYRDYQDNALYNSSFELGKTGWEIKGKAKIIKTTGDNSIQLQVDASISQDIPAHDRMMFVSAYKHLDLCLISNEIGILEVTTLNSNPINWPLVKGKNCIKIPVKPFQTNKETTLTLIAKSSVQIDEIKLSGFTQKLGLYDTDGKPEKSIKAYRKLNNQTEG